MHWNRPYIGRRRRELKLEDEAGLAGSRHLVDPRPDLARLGLGGHHGGGWLERGLRGDGSEVARGRPPHPRDLGRCPGRPRGRDPSPPALAFCGVRRHLQSALWIHMNALDDGSTRGVRWWPATPRGLAAGWALARALVPAWILWVLPGAIAGGTTATVLQALIR